MKEIEKDANNCKELEINVFGITEEEYENAEIKEVEKEGEKDDKSNKSK